MKSRLLRGFVGSMAWAWILISCSGNATLPVEPQPRKAALLFVVDTSAGMGAPFLEGIKEACRAARLQARKENCVGIMTFDLNPQPLVPLEPVDRVRDRWEGALSRIKPHGGTRMLVALSELQRIFQSLPGKESFVTKHVILLSDGDTPQGDFEGVVRKGVAEGMTVSTLCVATARFDAVLMSQIAGWGRGRFLFTDKPSSLKPYLVNEVRRALQ